MEIGDLQDNLDLDGINRLGMGTSYEENKAQNANLFE